MRGEDYCRGCGESSLNQVLDLGNHPSANNYVTPNTSNIEIKYPLKFSICDKCGLGQIGEYLSNKELFENYSYLSSTSQSWLRHCKNFVNNFLKNTKNIEKTDYVLEIASNDGYLLQFFRDAGIKVLGVEPAINIASIANSNGIPTLNSFFNSELALQIVSEHGYPKLIIANNVLAHVPDIQEFILALSIITNYDTIISIENASLLSLKNGILFDQIYHEHFSYLSAKFIFEIFRQNNLFLNDVEILASHSGSLRYWISRTSMAHPSVKTQIDLEVSDELFKFESWKNFSRDAFHKSDQFRTWCLDNNNTNSLVGFGAAAKGNTLLNFSRINNSQILFIVDNSVEKQGKLAPGSQIPIFGSEFLTKFSNNSYVFIIFPWNLVSEITSILLDKYSSIVKEIWVPLPELKKIY